MIQGSESFRLVVRRGPQPNQAYDLNKDLVTLGRDITNDIVINDPEVSRHHLRLTRIASGVNLEDLGSTNGTFVNGQRLTGPRVLRAGDMIGLGETVTLAFEQAPAAGTVSAEPPPGGTMLSSAQRSAPQPAQPAQPAYAPPQPSSPYAPPQGYPPPGTAQPAPPPAAAQGYSSYTPAQQSQPYAASTGYTGAQPSQPYGASVATPAQMPPGAGYGDYDPYAAREEGQSSTARYVLIGCAAISVLCCCGTILGAVAVDQLCLWTRLPVIYPLLQALGYVATCQ